MKAKNYLLQIKKLDRLVNNKIYEREQWLNIATGTTTSTQTVKIGNEMHVVEKVQSSGRQSKMADAIDKYVDIEAEINSDINHLIEVKQDIIKTIENLSDVEYDLLHKVYVQGKTLDKVANDYDKGYSWATTVHGRALANLQKILNEREKGEIK